MTNWKPITLPHLEGIIEISEYKMSETERLIWNKIKLLSPVKWQNHPMGNEGNGFWVVATYGNSCLYYNDIEDGFNESPFKTQGIIEEYKCNQIKLHDFIRSAFCNSSIKAP